jgi:ADP-ribose pyrophosphatase YjhB (NUDIX family)
MSTTRFTRRVPEGDSRERSVCDTCGFVDYENPRVVVGCVPVHGERILLCRRAIEPRSGFWTLPAGFMEMGESTGEGAAREAREEALAEVEIGPLLAIYNVARIGQVHLFYAASLPRPEFGVGDETLEVRLFAWDEIPWSELAFPSVEWALQAWHERRGRPDLPPRCN